MTIFTSTPATGAGSSVPVRQSLSTAFVVLPLTVGVTALRLITAATPVRSLTTVKADPANTGVVYLITSGAGTIATGYPLAAGDVVIVDIDDLNKLWFIASVASQKLAAEAST